MQKLTFSTIARSVCGRACNPVHWLPAARLQWNRKRDRRSYDDAQLKFFAQILPADFLHFAYFDDTSTQPEDITVNDLLKGQRRYAEVLLEQIVDVSHPVLDVGCGMGGLSAMMLDRGFAPVALTPDRLQINHIRSKYPTIPLISGKFENLCPKENAQRFGTVVNSESLQYLKLPRAIPLVDRILRAGGRWVVCDFFYREPSDDKSCHEWNEFCERISQAGWRISHQHEITENVLPTLRYAHMWATKFGLPLMDFSAVKLRKKNPGLHYLLTDLGSRIKGLVTSGIQSIDPQRFLDRHCYMLLTIERTEAQGPTNPLPIL